MFDRENSPGPDRYAEGFSIFIASTILLGLIDVGRFRLPSLIAKVISVFLIACMVFGVFWASQGFIDRRYNQD